MLYYRDRDWQWLFFASTISVWRNTYIHTHTHTHTMICAMEKSKGKLANLQETVGFTVTLALILEYTSRGVKLVPSMSPQNRIS